MLKSEFNTIVDLYKDKEPKHIIQFIEQPMGSETLISEYNDAKINYIKETYDWEMCHKMNKNIKIVGVVIR